jgi:hypothetical protein
MSENETPQPPTHLRLLPADEVNRLAQAIRAKLAGSMPYTLGLEVAALQSTRTRHDAVRVCRALRHAYGHEELAQMVERLLGETVAPTGILGHLAAGERAS